MSYDTDKERPTIFDGQRIRQLREDAALHNVDYSRGQIAALDGGTFRVTLDKPLVDISFFVPAVPTRVEAKHSAAAEGELLTWLVAIQRGERRTVRAGSNGMSAVDIARTPLTQDEIDRYTNRRSGADQIERLRIQLSDAIKAKARAKAAKQAATDLNERYGLHAGSTVAASALDNGLGVALAVPQRTRRK
ncbi:hypothetical protein [Pseudomonas fluorescens]|uniref:Uncharacterized protein n=1 Tax=Pseudomonas fluorescens TaxID=294 RepID=A0A0F4SYE1_PSEFL|nr:hypothetical protein [Pseudomonas fluorescens]KJZ37198.1 hypothetical protein VC34_26245 [Pseudomonas fluorescens]